MSTFYEGRKEENEFTYENLGYDAGLARQVDFEGPKAPNLFADDPLSLKSINTGTPIISSGFQVFPGVLDTQHMALPVQAQLDRAQNALLQSASTIVNAQGQLNAIDTNGIVVYSGASKDSGARVLFNSLGIVAFNAANNPTFTVDAANGNVSLLGSLVAGSTISGAAITGSDLTIGSGNNVFRISSSDSFYAFWAGHSNPTSAKTTLSRSGIFSTIEGNIGPWNITSTSIQTGSYNTSGTRYFGNLGLSVSNTFRVTSGGVLTAAGATFTTVNATGTINATAGNFSGNITLGGNILTGTSGNYFRLQGTNNELRFFTSSVERMRLDSSQLTFWASNGSSAGRWRGELLFGSLPFISTNANIHCDAGKFVSVGFNTIIQEGVQFSFGVRNTFRHMPSTIDGIVFSSIGMGFGGAVGFDVDGQGVSFVDTSGNYVIPSDIRLKTDIKDYKHNDILGFFNKLTPITYKKKPSEFEDKRTHRTIMHYDDKTYVGLPAQNVQENDDMECLVTETEGYLGIAYDNFIPYIILGIQELTVKFKNIEQRLSSLESNA